jgi:2-polyprenyl-3-methyl-5-hydroxy-6-metoxy-1,4-benzoquinol methylase
MAHHDARDINRAHWDDRAEIHARDATGFYRIAEFRTGADTLTPIETAELGDVSGLRVLHLQCHLGLDTLSLVRRGAIVTGLDFSAKALGFARQLSAETGLHATFVEGDVHKVRDLVEGTFDLVFATWGIFCWIPDVARWLRGAASMLHPAAGFTLPTIIRWSLSSTSSQDPMAGPVSLLQSPGGRRPTHRSSTKHPRATPRTQH